MTTNKIVHFVYFETLLCNDEFFGRWKDHYKSPGNNSEVTLQESKKGNLFTYIAKHYCNSNGFDFEITKEPKTTRTKQTEIKKIQLGGYAITQQQHASVTEKDNYKLFIFLDEANTGIYEYVQLQASAKLNIYQAYFENCSYAYILEYFIKQSDIVEFKNKLHEFNTVTPLIYKDF